ncbi:type II secretion system minor pseudopilin GspJ [Marinobacterium stanieri]|uniref:Type II secretion system protein J n=1 Tax=Marinobacterium stanieri TaxID=49186 RepID=A0A1N6XIN7_9GAMM|nr:type II secretion system minor pseudopilin GspJ [Marinobacterium stanieri]SIR02246.1 type II secretion system protein J (GspJ) [Marinobacterium stanieri]
MRYQHGFTLLEMLVSVALLALLGLAAMLTLGAGVKSEQAVGDSIDSLQRLQSTQQWLRRDLEQIVFRAGRTDLGEHRRQPLIANLDDEGESEGVLLDFYRTGRRILSYQVPVSQLERVRYRFSEGRLYRDSSPYLEAPAHERWNEAVLMENVKDLKLRFYYGQNWHDGWAGGMSNGIFASELPKAVEILIDTERYGAVSQTLLLPEGL